MSIFVDPKADLAKRMEGIIPSQSLPSWILPTQAYAPLSEFWPQEEVVDYVRINWKDARYVLRKEVAIFRVFWSIHFVSPESLYSLYLTNAEPYTVCTWHPKEMWNLRKLGFKSSKDAKEAVQIYLARMRSPLQGKVEVNGVLDTLVSKEQEMQQP